MSCPPEIAEILLDILQTAVLRIRAMDWSGVTSGYGIEADHIHNLPNLLKQYSPESLRYYWEFERPTFIARSMPGESQRFEPLWERLRPHVESIPAKKQAV